MPVSLNFVLLFNNFFFFFFQPKDQFLFKKVLPPPSKTTIAAVLDRAFSLFKKAFSINQRHNLQPFFILNFLNTHLFQSQKIFLFKKIGAYLSIYVSSKKKNSPILCTGIFFFFFFLFFRQQKNFIFLRLLKNETAKEFFKREFLTQKKSINKRHCHSIISHHYNKIFNKKKSEQNCFAIVFFYLTN